MRINSIYHCYIPADRFIRQIIYNWRITFSYKIEIIAKNINCKTMLLLKNVFPCVSFVTHCMIVLHGIIKICQKSLWEFLVTWQNYTIRLMNYLHLKTWNEIPVVTFHPCSFTTLSFIFLQKLYRILSCYVQEFLELLWISWLLGSGIIPLVIVSGQS